MNVRVPGSKSITHRALWLAAQAPGRSHIHDALVSADTGATMRLLADSGAQVSLGPAGVSVEGGPLRAPDAVVDCANSGTTMRFALATFARLGAPVRLVGDGSLRRRSHGSLLDALATSGAAVRAEDGSLTVRGPIHAGRFTVAGSSQFTSALLLALPFLEGVSWLTPAATPSIGYTTLTVDVAARFGITARPGRIDGGQEPRATSMQVEGDWSSAAFVLAAAALTGTACTVANVSADSHQPDRACLDMLARFGVRAHGTGGATVHAGGGIAAAGNVDVSATPDLFPVACVLAAAAAGTTCVQGTRHLREKESDRIRAMANGLRRLGATVVEHPEGLTITGPVCGLDGTSAPARTIDAGGDHRIHMAFSVLRTAGVPCTATDPASADVSFPGFAAMLQEFA